MKNYSIKAIYIKLMYYIFLSLLLTIDFLSWATHIEKDKPGLPDKTIIHRITIEDTSPQSIGCYGNKMPKRLQSTNLRKRASGLSTHFNFPDSHQSRVMTLSSEKYAELNHGKLSPEEIIHEDNLTMPPFYKDSPEIRKQHVQIYNSIKLVDNQINELLEKLERDHIKDSTIIFFYGDHGEEIPRGKLNGINLGYFPSMIWFPSIYRHLSP